MAEITYEIVKDIFEYDPITGNLIWKSPRSKIRVGEVAGYIAKCGYRMVGINGKYHLAHRIVWLLCHGQLPVNFIDHINGKRTDNRLENLRLASRLDNAKNRSIHKNNKCGFKGVSPRRGKYTATIRVNGKNKFLGDFDTPEKASDAYIAMAKKIHGEFMRNV